MTKYLLLPMPYLLLQSHHDDDNNAPVSYGVANCLFKMQLLMRYCGNNTIADAVLWQQYSS